MESAIENTLRDIKKLEDQISWILTSLKTEELINEAPLLPIPLIPPSTLGGQQNREEKKEIPTKRKVKPLSASQIESKRVEIDSAPVPMDTSFFGDDQQLRLKPGTNYTLIESSLFLMPVLDNFWVVGMTLVNSFDIALQLPRMILNIIPADIDSLDKPCRVFTYSVQVNPLDVKQAAMDNRRVCQGIPYHDTIVPHGNNIKIQPGCQVLVTGKFSHPLEFCSIDNHFNLLVTICLEGKQLWSRTVPAGTSILEITKMNENAFKTHEVSILSALGQHKEYFKMERLLSQGDKSPHRALEKFLVPLGFAKVYSENIGIDRSVEVFTTTQSALLWGMSFKYEKCCRNVNMIRCLVSARSGQQLQIFSKIFENWLRKEGQRERNKGLKGLSVSRMISFDENKNMMSTLRSEVQTLMELIRLGQEGMLKKASSQMDHQWINSFKNALAETDFIFM